MKKYLDVTSLVNSDFYKKNQRLSWHISHTEYNKFASDLYNLLEKNPDKKILAIVGAGHEKEILDLIKKEGEGKITYTVSFGV